MQKINEKRIKPGGSSRPDTCRVRLVWWPLPTTAANKGWGKEPPHCREISLTVLGVWSPRNSRFTVHAVLPEEPLPEMNSGSRALFVKAARTALAESLSVNIEGLKSEIVDWEGRDANI